MSRGGWALLAVALLAPAGAAGWGTHGSLEPDTPQDVDGRFMYPDPPGVGEEQVVLNAVVEWTQGGVSPNPLPGGRVAPSHLTFVAYLGVWKDCNQDGYMGAAQGALWTYGHLLSDPVACPPGDPHRRPADPHQDPKDTQDVIVEFFPIRPKPQVGNGWNWAWTVWDDQARVWGDFGRPDAPPAFPCPLTMPPGTTRGTGGLLAYTGCTTDHVVTRTITEADPGLGLGFQDPEHPERECDSLLAQEFRLHDPDRCTGETGLLQRDSGTPAFTVWDCSRPHTHEIRDPTAPDGERGTLSYGYVPILLLTPPFHRLDPFPITDEKGRYVSVPEPRPAVHDPRGSYVDATTLTLRGLGATQYEGCAWWAFNNTLPPPTSDTQPVPPARRRNDFPMIPGSMMIVGAAKVAALEATGEWRTETSYGPPDPRAATLVRGDANMAPPLWVTFYAHLGASTLSTHRVPTTTPGVYGAGACGSLSSGIQGGWACDKNQWWNPDYGAPTRPVFSQRHVDTGTWERFPMGAVVGDPYHLRDVDCHDGHLAADAVYASAAPLSEEGVCPAPTP